jgi:hypothetical protein
MAAQPPLQEDRFMMRNPWPRWGAVLLAAVLALPAAAADSPLAVVPADAALVVHVRGFERTRDRLLTLVKNAVPDLAQKVEDKVNEALKSALMGRELKGMPADGSILLVLTEASLQPDEVAAVIVRVSDYQQFLGGLLKEDERKALKKDPAGYETTEIEDKPVYLIRRDNYAVLTARKDVAGRFTDKAAKSLADRADTGQAKKLLEADVGVYVNMAVINKQLAEPIKLLREQIEKALEQSTAGGADDAALDMNKRLADTLFQAVADSQTVLATWEFRPEGVAGHAEVTVPANSKTNNLLKPARSAALTERLGRLPAGDLLYVAGQLDLPLFRDLMARGQGLLANPKSPEAREFKDAAQALADAQPWQVLASYRLTPTQGLTVTDYRFPDKAATAQLEMYRAYKGSTQGEAVKEPKVKANAEKYRGFKFHSVSMAWDFDKMMAKSGELPQNVKEQMIETIKKSLGDGTNAWFGTDGKVLVQITAKDWDTARKLFDGYLDGKDTAGGTASFTQARKNLPAEATVVMVFDVPRYVEFTVQLVRAMLTTVAAPNMPDFKAPAGKYSYFGMAATLQSERGCFDLWLPGSAIRDFRELFEPLLKGFLGG